MNTVLMPVAVVRNGDSILLRKMDPAKSPYKELWALFGGRVEDSGGMVVDALTKNYWPAGTSQYRLLKSCGGMKRRR